MNIGIIIPSNNQAGAQKLAAICGSDLANSGWHVDLFIPRLPYYYYFVTLQRNLIGWIRTVRYYVSAYCRDSSFCFMDLLETVSSKGVHTHNVLRRPSRQRLKKLDFIIVMTIAQVAELKAFFPQERTIYYILHPEEMAYGHKDTFRRIRHHFPGKIIALSPWTANQVADHIPKPPVLLAVVSPVFWENRDSSREKKRPKDILFHYCVSGNKASNFGEKILKSLYRKRPQTLVTVWTRDQVPDLLFDVEIKKSVSEHDLYDLYLSHKMLLFPSSWEGFGMPPIEGMACGCLPILRSGVGAADLYARDNDNAILIEEDLDETAEKIARLLDNDKQLERMRISAEKALEPFNPIGYGKRLLSAAGVDLDQSP